MTPPVERRRPGRVLHGPNRVLAGQTVTGAPQQAVQASPATSPTPQRGTASTRTPAPPAPPAEAVRVCAATERLRERWTRAGADIATRLRPGAPAQALDAVAHRMGLAVPAGARAWWSAVDGVDPVRTRYRASAPTTGPGGWVPLSLADAVHRAEGRGPGPGAPPGLLPLFARDEGLLAVRLGNGRSQVEQLVLGDDGEGWQHEWRVPLDRLLSTWADAMLAVVLWLPDAHDWVVDPFALQALPDAHLLD